MSKYTKVVCDWEREFAFLPVVVHSYYSAEKEATVKTVIWWEWYEEKWDKGWRYRREIGQKEGIADWMGSL